MVAGRAQSKGKEQQPPAPAETLTGPSPIPVTSGEQILPSHISAEGKKRHQLNTTSLCLRDGKGNALLSSGPPAAP